MPRKRKGDEPGRHRVPPKPEPAPAPPKPETDEEQEYTELVLLVHAPNLAEAELFKTELEAHGIPAVLEGEGAGVTGIPDVGAGVPILVPEEFADQAAELIAELESAKPEGNALAKDEEIFEEDEDESDDLDELDELDELEDDDLEEDEDLDEDEDAEEDEDWEEEEAEEEDEKEDKDDDWEDDEDEDFDEDDDR
jgi:hypothetical protein